MYVKSKFIYIALFTTGVVTKQLYRKFRVQARSVKLHGGQNGADQPMGMELWWLPCGDSGKHRTETQIKRER